MGLHAIREATPSRPDRLLINRHSLDARKGEDYPDVDRAMRELGTAANPYMVVRHRLTRHPMSVACLHQFGRGPT